MWEGMLVSLFATHLIHGRTAAEAEHRAAEVRAILNVLNVMQATAHMLVGDFNAIHPNDSVGDPPIGGLYCAAAHPTAAHGWLYRLLSYTAPGYPRIYLPGTAAVVAPRLHLRQCATSGTPVCQ
jgi:hypothetical protein